jgi:hypothetical protein
VAADESAKHSYDPLEDASTKEYIRIEGRAGALQLIRDEVAAGFTAEFESKIIDAADIENPTNSHTSSRS